MAGQWTCRVLCQSELDGDVIGEGGDGESVAIFLKVEAEDDRASEGRHEIVDVSQRSGHIQKQDHVVACSTLCKNGDVTPAQRKQTRQDSNVPLSQRMPLKRFGQSQ